MATHSSILAWRIPGTGEPGGLPSMASHRVGHDWSDLASAAASAGEWSKSKGFFPGGSDCKESSCNAGDLGSIPGLGRSPGEGNGNPLRYSCLENPHEQRSLTGYSPWGCKELDRTEWLSTLSEWSKSKTLKTPNTDEDVDQQESLSTDGGSAKWYSHLEWQFDSLVYKIKYMCTTWSSNHAPSYLFNELKTYVHIKACTLMFTTALLTIANNWKQPKCPSKRWMD